MMQTRFIIVSSFLTVRRIKISWLIAQQLVDLLTFRHCRLHETCNLFVQKFCTHRITPYIESFNCDIAFIFFFPYTCTVSVFCFCMLVCTQLLKCQLKFSKETCISFSEHAIIPVYTQSHTGNLRGHPSDPYLNPYRTQIQIENGQHVSHNCSANFESVWYRDISNVLCYLSSMEYNEEEETITWKSRIRSTGI